jgi:hypothetical protein
MIGGALLRRAILNRVSSTSAGWKAKLGAITRAGLFAENFWLGWQRCDRIGGAQIIPR